MTLQEFTHTLGLDPAVLYAGAGGGLLRAMSRRQLRLRDIFLSPCCGALASAYLTLPAVQTATYIGLPAPPDNAQFVLACAFLIGSCAMWISDLAMGVLARKFGLPTEPEDSER